MNEFYEYIRIMLYPVGAVMLAHLAVVFPKLRLTLSSMAFYFLLWFGLLFVQQFNIEEYREVSNYISTPSLFMVVFFIFINFWQARRE